MLREIAPRGPVLVRLRLYRVVDGECFWNTELIPAKPSRRAPGRTKLLRRHPGPNRA